MPVPIIITIDGPAGAGKSTTARKVAEHLGYIYIDTGAMYRAVTLAAIESSTALTTEDLCALVTNVTIELRTDDRGQRTLLNGVDVSDRIRQPDVTSLVSRVSAEPCVREHLVALQRMMGQHGGVVMDGRDIGSVVFPHAHVKVYLVASIAERARRRVQDLTALGQHVNLDEVIAQIAERDRLDSSRQTSPLIKPDGAVEIDTTHRTIDEQVDDIIQLARNYQKAYHYITTYGNM
ncbi:MAG: (d)CMP kinase [Candidatus Kapaibacteriota bacterium]|jgi:cytidylate kinase